MEENKALTIDPTILTIGGYFRKHFLLCQTHNTQQDAFDALEVEYFTICKRNKYTSYEAFRVAKSRFYGKQSNR